MTESVQADGRGSRGAKQGEPSVKDRGAGESGGGAYEAETAAKKPDEKPGSFTGTGGQTVQDYHGPSGPHTVGKK